MGWAVWVGSAASILADLGVRERPVSGEPSPVEEAKLRVPDGSRNRLTQSPVSSATLKSAQASAVQATRALSRHSSSAGLRASPRFCSQ
jgi:hypothetical protein